MTIKVTLTIDSPDDTQTIVESTEGPYVLPVLFRAVNAAVASRPDEIQAISAAMRVLGEAISAAAPNTGAGHAVNAALGAIARER